MEPVPPENEQPPSSAEARAAGTGTGRLHELFRGSTGADEGAPAAVARACVDLMDVTGASVSLYGGSDVRTVWWSSDPVARQLAEAQFTLGDGPCGTVMEQGGPVFAADLEHGVDAGRWPLFARQAADLAVEAEFPDHLDDVPQRRALGTWRTGGPI
ncbi:hypothetical protein OG304_37320 [Streptomyces sp. NBC_00160]|uniref:hypothetical protein n=1 Tax=Streptomyces sp. NBC_00160 TaxID=2903628 RepID=UPI00224FA7EE|nr:hypothetical protein [Streptomyces sp. NBC_00160]MCX5309044.1 hypothetical protein [Streptomyces sp. NBC_00160]